MTPEPYFEDYKLKLDYVVRQYDRLWQRFHFFLTIELALFGYLGYLTFDKQNVVAGRFLGVLGAVVSLLWLHVSAQDRWLVMVYRERTNRAARRFAQGKEELAWFEQDHAAAEIPGGHRFLAWYWPKASITRTPALVSVAVLVVWLVVLAAWPGIAHRFIG